jgi:NADH:ubiquinone oxidoreductase subunit H
MTEDEYVNIPSNMGWAIAMLTILIVLAVMASWELNSRMNVLEDRIEIMRNVSNDMSYEVDHMISIMNHLNDNGHFDDVPPMGGDSSEP